MHKHHYIAAAVLFLAAFLMFCPKANADNKQGVWVFGDSLSSPGHGWAQIINNLSFGQMRNTARGGLRMVDVIMPDWLVCQTEDNRGFVNDQVVIWLGGNDGLQKTNVEWYERKLRDHLQFLEGRKCRVYLVLPPLFVNDHELAGLFEPYRIISERVGNEYDNVKVIDMHWDENKLSDGLHQNKGLHFWQAVQMVNVLGLTPPEEK